MSETQNNQTCNDSEKCCKPICGEPKKCCKGKKVVRCILFTILAVLVAVLVYTLV
jgi:hypothetical protein